LYLKLVHAVICERFVYVSCRQLDRTESTAYWHTTQWTSNSQLAPLALNLLMAPASEAYVQRIISICGDLTTGKRNRTQQSLECRVVLKLNSSLFG